MTDDRDQRFSAFKGHFPSDIGQHIQNYVTDTLLLHSRYIFTKRSVSGRYGCYCTHCKQNFYSEMLKHNSISNCPNCGSECTVKESGRGRKYLNDKAYFVYYEKSQLDPQSIIARGIYVNRNYSGDYLKVETRYEEEALYLFQQGKSRMYEAPSYWTSGKWFERSIKSRFSEYSSWSLAVCNYESIAEAVQGTPFQYSTWESYQDRDMVKFFDLFSRYPCIEYLTKMGMRYFVTAKIYGAPTYGAINWKGTRADQVLKLDKQQLREIRDSKVELHPCTLRLQQISKKESSNIPLLELQNFAVKYGHCFEDIKQILKYTNLRRIIAYANKQLPKIREGLTTRSFSERDLFTTWRDYIADGLKLEFDLAQEGTLFPPNLHQAHLNTIAQVKYKENVALDESIAHRADKLKHLNFESNGIFIRPASSAKELIKEGEILIHCVGGYAVRYATGSTNILFIRNVEEPNKPFFTMEIKGEHIIQVRGKKNCDPTPEVEQFINAFKTEKMNKKPKVIKSKSSKPQGVAV
ncbi:PcfJ domain-containing protein [Paenibacillus sp. 19GGS1-52]|uniref:PcfJ domain-containing protein n=1 Tax=Paenibacillus sp. 19GGS1-52 TaxID=2758563 RepID=UPI001EFBD5F2|nr:PcfJ domain-containing protein [Paenibacillus sp. 19GGS1-52]ULO08916.1 PcfJ domain-containing protein [Paenibacillus sp. 19GGS1-52]